MSENETSPPSSKGSSSNPPKNAPSWLKNFVVWAHASRHLLTALAAVLVALAALLRPQDHTVTKNSYETTAQGIAKVEDEIRKNHEDIVALRSYIEGVMHQGLPSPAESSSAAPAAAPTAGLTPLPRLHLLPRLGGAAPAAGAGAPVMAESSAMAAAGPPVPLQMLLQHDDLPPPPPVHDEPKPWKPPAFDAIEKK